MNWRIKNKLSIFNCHIFFFLFINIPCSRRDLAFTSMSLFIPRRKIYTHNRTWTFVCIFVCTYIFIYKCCTHCSDRIVWIFLNFFPESTLLFLYSRSHTINIQIHFHPLDVCMWLNRTSFLSATSLYISHRRAVHLYTVYTCIWFINVLIHSIVWIFHSHSWRQ